MDYFSKTTHRSPPPPAPRARALSEHSSSAERVRRKAPRGRWRPLWSRPRARSEAHTPRASNATWRASSCMASHAHARVVARKMTAQPPPHARRVRASYVVRRRRLTRQQLASRRERPVMRDRGEGAVPARRSRPPRRTHRPPLLHVRPASPRREAAECARCATEDHGPPRPDQTAELGASTALSEGTNDWNWSQTRPHSAELASAHQRRNSPGNQTVFS